MKAKVQARIFSSEKIKLEDAVPLTTPFSVHLDVCSLCNFKCKFCFQADEEAIRGKNLKRGLMDVALFKKIIDDLTQFPEKIKKVKIGLHGEPTMHPALPEMIGYLKSRDVTDIIEVFTNGSLLSPTLNRAMIEAGLSRFNISVEGLTSEKYLEIAHAKVDMQALVENVRDLYERRGDCRIYVKVVDDGLSEDDKRRFYELFGDICDEIFIEYLVPQWAETNKFEMETTGMYGQPVRRYKQVCPFLFMYLHFNFDGTASGCTLDWGKEVLIGDVTKESALAIWNGKRLRDLQIANLEKRRDEVPFCAKCMAPMVCCLEDLDGHTEAILQRMRK
jgi:MoaA/NifB/PqqE/SkfB family radical SAM enzyme